MLLLDAFIHGRTKELFGICSISEFLADNLALSTQASGDQAKGPRGNVWIGLDWIGWDGIGYRLDFSIHLSGFHSTVALRVQRSFGSSKGR